jgi:hypothetical protein
MFKSGISTSIKKPLFVYLIVFFVGFCIVFIWILFFSKVIYYQILLSYTFSILNTVYLNAWGGFLLGEWEITSVIRKLFCWLGHYGHHIIPLNILGGVGFILRAISLTIQKIQIRTMRCHSTTVDMYLIDKNVKY